SHACGIKTDGHFVCWGEDTYGQTSGPIASTDSFTQITAGYYVTCGIATDGHLKCWGLNNSGIVSGANAATETFTQVATIYNNTCALETDGHLACWGVGQTGAAPVITSTAPPGGDGTFYTHTYTATGSPVPSFALTSGSLPDALTLDPHTGVLSGTPTT